MQSFRQSQGPAFRLAVATSIVLLHLQCVTSIDQNADPWILDFNTHVGPDGPWNALSQPVDWPAQDITLLPSLTSTSLFITSSTCSSQDSACEVGPEVLWSDTGAHTGFQYTNSSPFDTAQWDVSLDPLPLQGQATNTTDRITLQYPGRADGFLDGVAITLAEGFTITYPGKSYYTMNTGFLSLDGGSDNLTWTSVNGTEVSYRRALVVAYQAGDIPSISYGLHIGSASLGINGSLVLGGYDRSRCITTPFASSDQMFSLIDIGLGVSRGGSAFSGIDGYSTSGLLQTDSQPVSQLQAMPNPGVPYLYLPKSTCSAIASHLPVSFDSDLGLYLWNTSDSAYAKITSSPHYMSFTFGPASSSEAEGSNSTIYVPFALLDLSLENPVVSTPTQYFPCSPYAPSDGSTYHLGRAFLQSAYLSQNWETGKVLLAQAPGPSTATIANQDVKTIASTDDTITAMVNPPLWNATWTGILTALPDNSTGASGNGTSSSAASSSSSSSGLSGGAIAGIVIGALAGVIIIAALAFLILRRRNRTANQTAPAPAPPLADAKDQSPEAAHEQSGLLDGPGPPTYPVEVQNRPIYEAFSPENTPKLHSTEPVELEGHSRTGELDGNALHHKSTGGDRFA